MLRLCLQDEQRLLQYLPHDAQAIDEERFVNPFQPRIPDHPLVPGPSEPRRLS